MQSPLWVRRAAIADAVPCSNGGRAALLSVQSVAGPAKPAAEPGAKALFSTAGGLSQVAVNWLIPAVS